MVEQKRNPKYSYFETIIKSDVMKFLSGVIKKNKSYGQLTSKALSEIDKQSNTKKSVENLTDGSSIKKLKQSPLRDASQNTPVDKRKSIRLFKNET